MTMSVYAHWMNDDATAPLPRLLTPTTEDPAHPLVEWLSQYEGLLRLVLHVPDLAACLVKLGTAALVCVDNLGDGSIIEVGPEGTNDVRLVLSAD